MPAGGANGGQKLGRVGSHQPTANPALPRLLPGLPAPPLPSRERTAHRQAAGQPARALAAARQQHDQGAVAPCRTCLIDLDDATVCDLLQQAQQRGLVVSQPRALVVRANVVNPDGPPRDGGAHQALPEALRPPKAQHGCRCCRCWQAGCARRWCWRRQMTAAAPVARWRLEQATGLLACSLYAENSQKPLRGALQQKAFVKTRPCRNFGACAAWRGPASSVILYTNDGVVASVARPHGAPTVLAQSAAGAPHRFRFQKSFVKGTPS